MEHPKLEQPLIDKLLVLANPRYRFQVGLRSAATKVLNNYELDMDGNPASVRSPSPQAATVVWNVSNVLRSAASFFRRSKSLNQGEQGHPNLHEPVELATRVEPPHSLGEA
jgi:hypothetical protein